MRSQNPAEAGTGANGVLRRAYPQGGSDAHSGLGDFGDRDGLNRASGGPDVAATRRCLSATRRHRAAPPSASSIHILRARECPRDDIIAASTSSFWSARSGCGTMECLREGIRNECLSHTIARRGHARAGTDRVGVMDQVSPPAKISFLITAWTPQFPSTTWVMPKSTPIVIKEIA